MSLFKSKKKFTVSERDPTYKVKYLGNVQTSMMRGDGCVDKPTTILWNNYIKTANAGIDMQLTICASGLKAITKEQGLTEYRAHRISYCIAHPKFPKLFVFVYRHEGKKLKVELRCHAVLCKTEAKAKAMAVQLHDKLTFALNEFMREKTRKQNARLTLQRTHSLPLSTGANGLTTRNKFLSTGSNFKPPVDRSASAPKLGSIVEDREQEAIIEEEEEEEEEEFDEDYVLVTTPTQKSETVHYETLPENGDQSPNGVHELSDKVFNIEIGNNVSELKQERRVQYHLDHSESDENDDDSSESGFSEQDTKENISNGSGSVGSDPLLTRCGSTTVVHSACCPMSKTNPKSHSNVMCLCNDVDSEGLDTQVSMVTYSPNANDQTAGEVVETDSGRVTEPQLSVHKTASHVTQKDTVLNESEHRASSDQSKARNGHLCEPIVVINQHRL